MNKNKIAAKWRSHWNEVEKRRCVSVSNVCSYLLGNNRCAVGALFPLELLKQSNLSGAVQRLIDNNPAILDYLVAEFDVFANPNGDDLFELQRLQVIHDNYDPSDWDTMLTEWENGDA